jgi:hypothetical protein
MAGMAAASGPRGLPQCRGLPGMASTAEHALEAAHSDALLPLPGMASEGMGSQAGDGVGPVVKRVEGGGDHAAAPDPDKAGAEEISWGLAEQLATQIVPGQRKSRSIKDF